MNIIKTQITIGNSGESPIGVKISLESCAY